MAIVTLPAMYIPDPTRSRALFYAKIYIGVADTDPTLPENQKPARLVQEDGSIIDAEYPIRTNEGGIPVYNGSEVAIDVDGDYSMAILDRNDAQIYYFANTVESSTVLQSNLNTIATLLDLTYDDIGTVLVTEAEGTNLDSAIYLFNSQTGEVWTLPAGIPAGSNVVSVTGDQLVTNNGTFTMTKRNIVGEATPINNQWNGFFDPKHQSQLPAPAGYPDPGGTSYLAGDEWSLDNFASGGSISSSDTGITFTVGVYKLFEYTSEQLALIDVNDVPVYIKDELGSEYFVTNATNGVNVTKPDATTLKVELTNAIFAELGITKVWRFFVTDKVGRVAELGVEALVEKLYDQLLSQRKWRIVTTSRVLGVTYTNDRPYDIEISVYTDMPSGQTTLLSELQLDGVLVVSAAVSGATPTSKLPIVFTIPAGSTYRMSGGGTLNRWLERF